MSGWFTDVGDNGTCGQVPRRALLGEPPEPRFLEHGEQGHCCQLSVAHVAECIPRYSTAAEPSIPSLP